jgi:acetoin utilization protein AcuB
MATHKKPTIGEVMTTNPLTIGSEQTVGAAKKIMADHAIRHLPVLHGGRLYGIVSDRDLKLVEAVDGSRAEGVKLSEVCVGEVYTVRQGFSLADVAGRMADDALGSAVVEDDRGHVIGIVTSVDMCRVLSSMLKE